VKILLAGYILRTGGIQSHLKWLEKSLAEAGVETLIISLEIKDSTLEIQQKIVELKQQNINVYICEPYVNSSVLLGWLKLKRVLELRRLIDKFEPDIYLAVGTGWNLFIPPLISKTKSCKIFHEVMSGEPRGLQDSRWCVRWGFDEVIGQSPVVSKTFSQCFGWRKKIHSLPAMPEPLERTAILPTPTLKTVAFGQAKAALFSRLEPHKQAFWLVQQWDLLKDFLGELHIHGSGAEETPIRNYIEAQGIGDRVKCFGRYPEGQAYVDLLSSYDLTLLPTIGAEGAPLVLLESMACGVPFVAYGVGGIPDYGVDNPNVSIVPLEGKAFISGVKHMVRQLADDQIDRTQLQKFYLENYSYAVLKNLWLSYFRDRAGSER
jgi:glycosyltransferase involved in cell wall biosynthesis